MAPTWTSPAWPRRCPRSKPLGARAADAPPARDHARGLADRDARRRGAACTACCGISRSPTSPRSTASRGSATGLYAKAVQPVVAAGGPKRALVYFGANAGPGRADADYLRAVIAAARHWRLPEEGLAALEGFARERAREAADAAAPRVRPRFATPYDR